MKKYLEDKELYKLNDYFKAANYLSVGQLYLLDNPLLRRKLEYKDIKPRIIGHWGTVPGQNFIYTHLNRVINKYDLDMIYVSGPGHGGNSIISHTYLEGSYSDVYPNISQDEDGMRKLFKQFSFPGGTSSHVAPEVPGSINEGGELGYSLSHAYGAVLDNKDLVVACVVGDGEAETGPLATSWHINKFINPITDGAVLPILHLNGYKIANPSILSRISKTELYSLFIGYGYEPYYIEGDNPLIMHEKMAQVMDTVIEKIKDIQNTARNTGEYKHTLWPMIILRTPKGWTGPKVVDRKQIENSFRAHQIPFNIDSDEKLKMLEDWLKSYEPNKLFDEKGTLKRELQELIPSKNRRMGSNKHANGGSILKDLKLPDFKKYELKFDKPGKVLQGDMFVLGQYIRDIIKNNPNNFRVFGPDEALSNRLNSIFEVTNRMWAANKLDSDEFLSLDGKVMDSMLSEHVCEGLLEGYLLTGRHGFFHTYESFSRIVDSMASQHAKWLKVTNNISWREDIASLNYILCSHVWQQDHNGYTHQDPGFVNHLVTKKADIVRIYYPFDANSLLSCFDHVIKSKNYINVIVASKHERLQWLNMSDTIIHCTKGAGIFEFASNDLDGDPDIVLACCGDTPTLEVLAATKILNENFPNLKIRVVNVVDLMKLQTNLEHPHGMTYEEFDNLFTKDKPVVFAYHGYPSLIHQLSYKHNNKNIHVRGYIEEGTITTPFDMRVQNKIDRYHLVMDTINYLPNLENASRVYEWCKDMLIKHKEYIREYGKDLDEVENFTWN